MNETRLNKLETGLRDLTIRLNTFHPTAEGFVIGSTRLLEKLVTDEYHLLQRDSQGVETDLAAWGSLGVIAGTGLNIIVRAGRARIDQTIYNFPTHTHFALLAASTYRVYVSVAGVITAAVVGAYPLNAIPLAVVVTGATTLTSITDERCLHYEDTAAGAAAPHAILDGGVSHTDTALDAVSIGSMIIGNATPAWDELVIAVPAANVRNVLGIDNAETGPSWKTALDATHPADIAAAATEGTSLVFSHRDHVHAHPVFGATDLHPEYMTPAEHTAVGDAAPHHAAITLGGGSDAALSLAAGQVLTLADVLTPAEHTAIGDAAPHHPAVTLDINTDQVFGIAGQVLSFDVQVHGFALLGPVAGVPAIPSFRALDVADLPVEAIVDGDFAAGEGFMRKTGAGTYIAHKSNLASAADPGVDDDVTLGYSVGSVWINTTLDKVWQCVDSTDGFAVWKDLGSTDHARLHSLSDVADHSHLTDYSVTLGLAHVRPGDVNFDLYLEAGGPIILVDAGWDFLGYVRASNYFNFSIGGVEYLRVGATGALVDDILELTAAHGVEIEGVKALDSFLEVTEIATPGNPAANQARLYAHDVGGVTKPMWLDSAGTETDLTAAGGGGGTKIVDADADTKVDVEEGADDDTFRVDLGGGGAVADALVATAAGGLISKINIIPNADSAINLGSSAPKYFANTYTDTLYLNSTATLGGGTAGQVTLTGNLDVSGNAAFGSNGAVTAGYIINATDQVSTATTTIAAQLIAYNMSEAAVNTYAYGVSGNAYAVGIPISVAACLGLLFYAYYASESPCTVLTGIKAGVRSQVSGTGVLTTARALWLPSATWTGSKPVTVCGIDIEQQGNAACTTAYGIRIADQAAGTTSRLLEVGTTPYLRVDGLAAPAAGLTNLWLYEGTTPALRNVGFTVADGTGHVPAGAKILYVV